MAEDRDSTAQEADTSDVMLPGVSTLSPDRKRFLESLGITASAGSMKVATKANNTACAACTTTTSNSNVNHTKMTNLPGSPFLCGKCIIAFVRFGVFVPANSVSAPVAAAEVDDDGLIRIGEDVIAWGV